MLWYLLAIACSAVAYYVGFTVARLGKTYNHGWADGYDSATDVRKIRRHVLESNELGYEPRLHPDTGLPVRLPGLSLAHNPPPVLHSFDPIAAAVEAGERAYLAVLEQQRRRPSRSQRHAILSPTEQFDTLVAATWDTDERDALAKPCSHCEGGRHEDCPACACPCSLVAAVSV